MGHPPHHRSSSSISPAVIDPLFEGLKRFLSEKLNPTKPVLLAFSGGADSMALFQLLLLCRTTSPFELHAAHIDHSWREESASEAKLLERLAAKHQVEFHHKKLPKPDRKGNLEERCRDERYRFFQELQEKYSFQAVFLAHQADDQAETVLKRVLEGASLTALASMLPVSVKGSLTLWRPLLDFPKTALIGWLEERGVSYFSDSSNIDVRYLRARMRQEMIPSIEQQLGKSIKKNLLELAEQAGELKSYLAQRTDRLKNGILQGPLGICWEGPFSGAHPIELKTFIKELLEKNRQMISRDTLRDAVVHLAKKSANKSFPLKNAVLEIDRGRFFLLLRPAPLWASEAMELSPGCYRIGPWEAVIEPVTPGAVGSINFHWQDIWRGEVSWILPQGGQVAVGSPPPSLKKRWSNSKIPAFLYPFIPYAADSQGKLQSPLCQPHLLPSCELHVRLTMRGVAA